MNPVPHRRGVKSSSSLPHRAKEDLFVAVVREPETGERNRAGWNSPPCVPPLARFLARRGRRRARAEEMGASNYPKRVGALPFSPQALAHSIGSRQRVGSGRALVQQGSLLLLSVTGVSLPSFSRPPRFPPRTGRTRPARAHRRGWRSHERSTWGGLARRRCRRGVQQFLPCDEIPRLDGFEAVKPGRTGMSNAARICSHKIRQTGTSLCPGGTFDNSPTFQRWEPASVVR
jgi:hypothetical protein